MKRVLSTALAVIVLIALIPYSAYADYDCSDFSSWEEAQQYLLPGDPYGLDRDNDGNACESLPSTGGYSAPAPAAQPQTQPESVQQETQPEEQPAQQETQPEAQPAQETYQPQTLAEPQVDVCAAYDAWTWAQAEFERDPQRHADLDPDGNGIACEHLPVGGFAPVLFTNGMPDSVDEAIVVSVESGNQIVVMLDGQRKQVRLQGVVAPTNAQCGRDTSSAYLTWMLGLIPNGTVHLETDFAPGNTGDDIIAYVWFEISGDVYLANEVMARNGYGEPEGSVFNPLEDDLAESGDFAEKHQLGVHAECGGFDATQLNTSDAADETTSDTQGEALSYAAPAALEAEPEAEPLAQNCDPSYPTLCLQSYPDLNCGDISARQFPVQGTDPHGFDRDRDGIGCES